MATGILTGKVVKWIENKGFGFIAPNKGDKQIFVHISSFDINANRKPIVGDTVYYYLSKDKSGRPCAASAKIAGVELTSQTPLFIKTTPRPKTNRHSFKFFALILCLLIFLFSFAYDKFSQRKSTQPQKKSIFAVQQAPPVPMSQKIFAKPSYTCEGKTGCHEMSSCEEAIFYLQNCPGTKIDGDNDGRPCERGPC